MVELDLALGVVLDVVAVPEDGELGALVQQLGEELVQGLGPRRGETAQCGDQTSHLVLPVDVETSGAGVEEGVPVMLRSPSGQSWMPGSRPSPLGFQASRSPSGLVTKAVTGGGR
jgi:hypothetical protein